MPFHDGRHNNITDEYRFCRIRVNKRSIHSCALWRLDVCYPPSTFVPVWLAGIPSVTMGLLVRSIHTSLVQSGDTQVSVAGEYIRSRVIDV